MSLAAHGRRLVLVTGGGGYLGSVLVPALLDDGWRVRVIDRLWFGRERLPEHPALEVLNLDTRGLDAAQLDGCDAVVDLAAVSNDPAGEAFAAATWAINHRARVSCALLARDAGIRRYVLASSCSLYGFRPAGEVCDEHSAIRPLTTYAEANAAAEADILPLAAAGLPVTVLRFATLFGPSPRMRFDLAVNGMTEGALTRGRLPLMRDGSQWRPFLHVADAADAIRHALGPAAAMDGIINVVGENVRLLDLARRITALVPRPVEITWYGDTDHRSYRVDGSRLAACGWRPSRAIEDGVREIAAAAIPRTPDTITLDWYRSLSRAGGDVFTLGGG